MKTISIENVEYVYSISKLEKEEGISIKLTEAKPNKNITFKYEGSTDKITKDIKILSACDNLEEMLNDLQDIFINDKITVEKREEKYYMVLEISKKEKLKKYEIELKKEEPIDEKKN